jgi:hypothetical protein
MFCKRKDKLYCYSMLKTRLLKVSCNIEKTIARQLSLLIVSTAGKKIEYMGNIYRRNLNRIP